MSKDTLTEQMIDAMSALAKSRAKLAFVAGWNDCEANMGVWIDAESAFENYWETAPVEQRAEREK